MFRDGIMLGSDCYINYNDIEVTKLFLDNYGIKFKAKALRPAYLTIKNVIFNPPATIVFWEDGTKTVVKAINEDFDPEKGLAMAISKKAFGNEGNYFNEIKKWTEKYDEESNYPEIEFTLDNLREAASRLSERLINLSKDDNDE